MTKLSYEDKRQIQNKLTFITLATDKMAHEREQIYKLVEEIKEILEKNGSKDD
jgi:hypothetical protein